MGTVVRLAKRWLAPGDGRLVRLPCDVGITGRDGLFAPDWLAVADWFLLEPVEFAVVFWVRVLATPTSILEFVLRRKLPISWWSSGQLPSDQRHEVWKLIFRFLPPTQVVHHH